MDQDGRLAFLIPLIASELAALIDALLVTTTAVGTAEVIHKNHNGSSGIGVIDTLKVISIMVHSESGSEVPDSSGKEGAQGEVDDFVDALDGVSEPQSDNNKIRMLKPGIKVDDLKGKAPGTSGDNGRNKTAEGGNIGIHESSTTRNSDGSRAKTLDVHRPTGSGNRKYIENN